MQMKRHIAAVMELNWPFQRHGGIFAGIQDYAEKNANWSFDLGNYPELQLADGVKFDGVIGRISKDCLAAERSQRNGSERRSLGLADAAELPGRRQSRTPFSARPECPGRRPIGAIRHG
jgi:hypothetical protein